MAQASPSATEAALIIHYLLGTLKIQTDPNPPRKKSTYKCRGLENACLSVSIQWVSVTLSGDCAYILVKLFSMLQLLSVRHGKTGSVLFLFPSGAVKDTCFFFLLLFSLDVSIFTVSFAKAWWNISKILHQGKSLEGEGDWLNPLPIALAWNNQIC